MDQKDRERKVAWVSWEKLCTLKAEGGMGFRDLKAFNLALLAKQWWRMLQSPNSLVHKVFKAKYVKTGSFNEAELGRRPSYAWRSMLAARKVVDSGSRWCRGNGERVHIWKDRWIPSPESFKVTSPIGGYTGMEKVSTLLDTDRRSWDVAKVKTIFLPHEVEMVLSIPISGRLPKDSIIWAWTTNGRFTVKSAYKVAQKVLKEDFNRGVGGSSSDNSGMKAIWKIVWRLNCPSKIKHLLWRACKNILPTKLCLKARGINVDEGCDICGSAESSGHALWSCKLAEAMWSCTRLKLPCFQEPLRDFIDIMWEIK